MCVPVFCSLPGIPKSILCCATLITCLVGAERPVSAFAAVEAYGDEYVIVANAHFEEYASIYDSLYLYASAEIVWFNMERFEPSESIDGGPPVQAPYTAFSAIFRIVPDNSNFTHQFGLPKQDMLAVAEDIKQSGGEIIQLEAYTNLGGDTRYAYIAKWFPGGPQAWDIMLDVDAQFFAEFSSGYPNVVNYCLTETEFGPGRVSALFRDDFSNTAYYTNPVDFNSLHDAREHWEPLGYRLTSLEIVNSNNYLPRYLPVFKKMSGLSTTVIQAISAESASSLGDYHEQEFASMRPLFVAAQNFSSQAGIGWGASPFFKAYWVGRPKRKRELTSGGNQILAPTYD